MKNCTAWFQAASLVLLMSLVGSSQLFGMDQGVQSVEDSGPRCFVEDNLQGAHRMIRGIDFCLCFLCCQPAKRLFEKEFRGVKAVQEQQQEQELQEKEQVNSLKEHTE